MVLGAPPWAVFILILAIGAVALNWVLRNIGTGDNQRQKLALCTGLIVGLIPMGILSQVAPIVGLVPVLLADVGAIFFLYLLSKKYSAGAPRTRTPPGRVASTP